MTISQEAREAAWLLRPEPFWHEDNRTPWMNGQYDNCQLLQAFAAFEQRILTQAEARTAAAVREARRNAYNAAAWTNADLCCTAGEAYRTMLAAIRQIEEPKP